MAEIVSTLRHRNKKIAQPDISVTQTSLSFSNLDLPRLINFNGMLFFKVVQLKIFFNNYIVQQWCSTLSLFTRLMITGPAPTQGLILYLTERKGTRERQNWNLLKMFQTHLNGEGKSTTCFICHLLVEQTCCLILIWLQSHWLFLEVMFSYQSKED